MKKILEHENWVEIPSGEFITGLSLSQRNAIIDRFLQQANSRDRGPEQEQLLQSAADKLRKYPPIRLASQERRALCPEGEDSGRIILAEEALAATPLDAVVHLHKFYIARFPITEVQYRQFLAGIRAEELPDALDEPEVRTLEIRGEKTQVLGRWASPVQTPEVVRLCEALGARLPTSLEWEKAARGTDGRLYPWGNEWDPAAGFFSYDYEYRGPGENPGRAVTGYPCGVSPYGLWAMAGAFPELVTVASPRPIMTRSAHIACRKVLVDVKGCHAKESSEAFAWFDHILALPGRGFWVSLRLVLDEWPKTQWTGTRPQEGR